MRGFYFADLRLVVSLEEVDDPDAGLGRLLLLQIAVQPADHILVLGCDLLYLSVHFFELFLHEEVGDHFGDRLVEAAVAPEDALVLAVGAFGKGLGFGVALIGGGGRVI